MTMSVSASEVRRFAVAACAHHARDDARTKATYTQAQLQITRAFAGNTHARSLIGDVDTQARALTDARRDLTARPADPDANTAFHTAAARLEHTTDRLIGMTAVY